MKKVSLALATVLALGAGFASHANATDCPGTVSNVCQWLYPKDGTLEGVKKYGSCVTIGVKLCSSNRANEVTPTNLERMVQQSPVPDDSVLQKHEQRESPGPNLR